MAISLTGLARAFQRVAGAPVGSPERRVGDAMRAFPELVSGTDREDLRLMRGIPGLLTKAGAEAVHGLALPGVGAVAVKIDDGAVRARDVVVAAALRLLGVDAPLLDELARPEVKGGGLPVGEVRAVPLWGSR
jgi:L-asparaginase II